MLQVNLRPHDRWRPVLGSVLAVLSSFDRRDGGKRRTGLARRRPAADPPESDDAALAERFAAAEPDAIRQLYARFGRPVFTVAFSVLHDRALAAEAVQMTFVKAWRATDSYDAARPLAPWLYSIARRTAIDIARSERRHSGHELRETDAPTADHAMDHVWEAWQVRRAVDRLDPREREIVRLQHFAQLTHDEIAGRLSIPIGTVKSRSHRAHQRLAHVLTHLREEGAA
jgi:RNA polymerase sigma-70 factor (ECF subfamily)